VGIALSGYLSNFLLNFAAFIVLFGVVWALTFGPRFKSRRACNWTVLRAAALVSNAIVTDDGWRRHKLLRVTWQTELGSGANASAATVEVAVSRKAPWDVRVRILQSGKANGLIATYGWRQWPRAFHDVDCASRKEMRDNIVHSVRVALHVHQDFSSPLELAQAVQRGFPGIDFEDTSA
jgi:hypothetical protein